MVTVLCVVEYRQVVVLLVGVVLCAHKKPLFTYLLVSVLSLIAILAHYAL